MEIVSGSKKSLQYNNITEEMSQVEKYLQQFFKNISQVRKYSETINKNNSNYYIENQSDIAEIITKCQELDEKITDLIQEIDNYDINHLLNKQTFYDKRNIFSSKLERYRKDLEQFKTDIRKKESYLKDINKQANNSNDSLFKNMNSIGFDDNPIQLISEITTNANQMTRRRKDLESIKMTSAQIKDLASDLRTDVYKQREVLNSIEDNIIVVQDNANKADDEIKKANELSKSTRRKVIWIIVIIAFIVIAAGILWYMIYSNTTS